MFKHRFNQQAAADFTSVINSVDLMIGRAKSTLNMMTAYFEGDCDDLHNHDVSGVVYGVLAELEDVGEVLNAHFKANNNLQKQVDAMREIILKEKYIDPELLDFVLKVATMPESEQVKAYEAVKQSIEADTKTIH